MVKKEKEQVLARHLRKKGKSLNEIAKTLSVSKSSVSLWVSDIKLTKPQLRALAMNPFLREAINKRATTRLKNEAHKRQLISNRHKEEIKEFNISIDDLLLIGICLYWGEGRKSGSCRTFGFSNSDPDMVKVIMCFLRKVIKIPEDKIRGHIILHGHLNKEKALEYWSKVSGISKSQFQKTSTQHSKASKNTRDNLPYGTVSIDVYSVDLYLKMLAWIDVLKDKVINKYEK